MTLISHQLCFVAKVWLLFRTRDTSSSRNCGPRCSPPPLHHDSWTGAKTGRGADFIIIDDPLKVEEALSETRRSAVNEAYHTSVSTRLNRDTGGIILIMQRLHANDLTAFVQKDEHWDVVALPAIAEKDETYSIQTP